MTVRSGERQRDKREERVLLEQNKKQLTTDETLTDSRTLPRYSLV